MENRYSFAGQEDIISPQLVYYREIIEENIRLMIRLAGGSERLWPHVKTHKMIEMVRLLMEMGISRFKCATIAECEMCGEAGAERAVLAYPLLGPNIERFLTLKKKFPGTYFYAVSDNTEQVKRIGEAAVEAGEEVSLLVDVDMGQHRTGVPIPSVGETYHIWSKIAGVKPEGMHCYDGHRHESDVSVRERYVREADEALEAVKKRLTEEGYACEIMIMGGTPSFPCHQKLTGEYLSPGTCVIQDAGYAQAYPDLPFVPGAAVLTRVVSRPGRYEFTLDMGTKAVASDPAGERAVIAGMEYAQTVLQNEEHWVVRVPQEHVQDIPPVGTVLFAVPTHVCPTSALYPEVPVVAGGKLDDWWEVTARNRKITI
ncbi:D-TA family PLP-dependent enzyme [Lachnospiraceae bacterium JLR.KK008]